MKAKPAPKPPPKKPKPAWGSGRLEPGGYRPPAGTIAAVLQDDRE